MKRLYVSAPIDEIRLAEAVAPGVRALGGHLPSAAEVRQRTRTHGVDFATMELREAILAVPEHRDFIAAVDAEPMLAGQPAVAAKVLFVPALFHRHYPESGADAAFAADVARQCGFEVATVPIRSVATVAENAGVIRDHLRAETASKLWLFTVSKGSADFRAFLQSHASDPGVRPERIAGWINVAGLPSGSHLVDHLIESPWRALRYRALCRLMGTSYDLLHELSTRHERWREPPVVPAPMQVINFMALPLGCHIQTSLVARYSAISALGPNDGMVSCRESVIEPGLIYPVWGCDHFFRGPQVVPLLYRFFSWLRRQ